MTYFNVLSIRREGEISDPSKSMGSGEELFNVTNIGMEKNAENEARFIVEVEFERIMNKISQFKIKVTTTWLIIGLNKQDEENEFGFLRALVVRSVSHLYGELACTYQNNNWPMMLPHNDPQFSRPFEITRMVLRDFFKAQ
jgi:hypothetical protein